MAGLRCVQINLHHCIGAMAILARHLRMNEYDIALIQEPYIKEGKIRGLGGTGDVIFHNCSTNDMRTCVYVRNGINAMPLYNFCSRDLTTVKIDVRGSGGRDTVILTSAYFDYMDKEIVSRQIKDLVEYGSRENLDMILGCDANAHHTVWGSTDVNVRGVKLLEYVVSTSLQILNKGNRPTFADCKRAEVIDITLASNRASTKIVEWHVSDEITLSDHNYICFKYRTLAPAPTVCRRNPRNTDWNSFRSDLRIDLEDSKGKLNSILDIEFTADKLVQTVNTAWTNNCPERELRPKRVPWWTPELVKLRQEARRAFNNARTSRDYSGYARCLTNYNKAVRKAKRKAWRAHCEDISTIPEGMRLSKAISTVRAHPLTAIKNDNGQRTGSGKETLAMMLNTHFPDCKIIEKEQEDPISLVELSCRTTKADWDTARKVVDEGKVGWALNGFQPFKSPGPDMVYPIILQQGAALLIPHLCRLYRACIAFGYIPKIWRRVKVIYIPKPGKADYEDAKAYRPISLESFFLKALEKLVDRHVREGALWKFPLHRLQCAYQSGKSTETALHFVVNKAEHALDNREVCIAAFLDIEGAFDRTTFDAISVASANHGIEPTICKWIDCMLRGRIIRSELLGDEMYATTTKGCPQGGVLSPLLWCLVVNSLLEQLNKGPYLTVGYADDLVILVNGKFPSTVSSLMQKALIMVEKWCSSNHLSINPGKTTVVPFTRKRDLTGLGTLSMYGTQLQWSTEVKYLGMTLDSKLTWKPHVDRVIEKAQRVFGMIRSTYGKTWGLKPKVIKWLYTMMIRPILTYGSIVWWPRTKLATCRNALSKVQRLACVAVTGAFPSTPTAALEVLLDLTPLHIVVESEAIKALHRLSVHGLWSVNMPVTRHTKLEISKDLKRIMSMGCDKMQPLHIFKKNFKIKVPTRDEWRQGLESTDKDCLIWYTDGSKMETGSGAGIYANDCKVSQSMGKYATVFQAETYAIIACAQENINNNVTDRTVYILSDSQAALKALGSCRVDSRLVLNCVKALNKLGRKNTVRLVWVPGHAGVQGNEEADVLARKGSEQLFVGPEPFVGLSESTVKAALNAHGNDKHRLEWMALRGLEHSKKFIANRATGFTRKFCGYNKSQVRLLTGAFTGHFGTKDFLCRLGLAHNLICRACGEQDESISHLLCECDALAGLRMGLMGLAYPNPEDFRLLPLKCTLQLMQYIHREIAKG